MLRTTYDINQVCSFHLYGYGTERQNNSIMVNQFFESYIRGKSKGSIQFYIILKNSV
ncbi:hypothetical protein Q2T41_02460 [Maribacter confluentis]|uniref:Uncharacterized protein n=1 Tax=Maribacter confluentis TaxID=1656093 RepID=A0ABT8RLS5_9FLAO|nr:hypothetical protein [Maribacter confluentis]MDO1511528.1 hypothetical protein [Maribacter confluentis]